MNQPPAIKMLYDGQCPVCVRGMESLRRRDRQRGRVMFEDMTADGFDASKYAMTHDEALSRLHAVRADGTLVHGMDAVRAGNSAIGRGWLWAPTGWPVVRPVFDVMYRAFARYRPRQAKTGDGACDGGRCRAAPDG